MSTSLLDTMFDTDPGVSAQTPDRLEAARTAPRRPRHGGFTSYLLRGGATTHLQALHARLMHTVDRMVLLGAGIGLGAAGYHRAIYFPVDTPGNPFGAGSTTPSVQWLLSAASEVCLTVVPLAFALIVLARRRSPKES